MARQRVIDCNTFTCFLHSTRISSSFRRLSRLQEAFWKMKTPLWLLFFIATCSRTSAKLHDVCVNHQDCDDLRQFCDAGHCACKSGLNIFNGGCHQPSHAGETCTDQIQCSMTDKNLHCIIPNGANQGLCQCRNGFQEGDDGLCSETKMHSATRDNAKPDFIKTKPTNPRPKDVVVEKLSGSDNATDFDDSPRKRFKVITDIRVLGPVAVVCVAILVCGICLCLWSVRLPSLQDDFYSVSEDVSNPKYAPRQQRGKENLAVADSELGVDNPAYNIDNMDAISHYTAQTEVCDANHQEYLQKTKELDQVSSTSTRKIIFGSEADGTMPSLTTSMDAADVEVAGIYKTFSLNNSPLVARMDSVSTPPPPVPKVIPRVPDIELVTTPDCTSIDTNIPQEEVVAFEEGVRRRKEFEKIVEEIHEPSLGKVESNEDDTKPEEDQKPQEDNEEAEEEAKRNSDYVDEVFKPVFSIA